MGRIFGAKLRLYFGGRDISADATDFNPEVASDTEDVTTFNSAGYHEFQGTLKDFNTSFNVFYQSGVGSIDAQIAALYGLTEISTISLNEAGAVGDNAILYGPAILEKTSEAWKVANLTKIAVSLKGTGGGGNQGPVLHVLGAETGSGTSTSVDNGALSSNGGRVTIHVTAITGSATVKAQHSVDNSTWVDLVTFTCTVIGAQTTTVTGTVNRYLRDSHTPGTTITYVLAAARF